MSTSTRQYIAGVWCVLVGAGAVLVYPHAWPENPILQNFSTVAAVLAWLEAVHHFSTGQSRRNANQLVSMILMAMNWSILACSPLLDAAFGGSYVWLGLAILCLPASAAFKLRAISAKYARRRALAGTTGPDPR